MTRRLTLTRVMQPSGGVTTRRWDRRRVVVNDNRHSKGHIMTTTYASRETGLRSLAPIGAAAALVAAAATSYGAHDWSEIVVVVAVIAVAAGLVFGLVVPRALRKDSAGGTALGLSVSAALLTLPAFWTGLPLVLGLAGIIVGNRGRTARSGAGKCIAALVIGAVAVLGYLTIYLWDGFVAGNAGFLFD